MITAIVNFQLPTDITPDAAAKVYEASVPLYQGVPGLVRKYYLFDSETNVAGGAGGGVNNAASILRDASSRLLRMKLRDAPKWALLRMKLCGWTGCWVSRAASTVA